MTGTLTASNCTIAANASSCNTNLNWEVLNPESSNTEVTTPTSITVGTGHSGSTTYSVSGGSPNGTRNFYLYNNDKELDTATATATCISGTSYLQWPYGENIGKNFRGVAKKAPCGRGAS